MEIYYASCGVFGGLKLIKLTVVRETPNKYYVDASSAESVVGNSWFELREIKKLSEHVFDDLLGALKYLVGRSGRNLAQCKVRLGRAQDQYDMVKAMLESEKARDA